MTPKALIKLLESIGFQYSHTTGSHYIYKKDDKRESIPFHSRDMKPGLLNAILKRNGLK
jgi:predicted RNA binding protein YcfA (HicA-like mRNA interferase family)